MNIDLKTYGSPLPDIPANAPGLLARITAVHRGQYELICDKGRGLAALKRSCYRAEDACIPTVGDHVMVDWQADGQSRILCTLPRRTYLARLDPGPGQKEQALAANFDTVCILQSLDRDFNLRRLERALTLAWESGATPVVLLTKADLAADARASLLAAQQLAIGVEVLVLSARTGAGLSQLSKYLRPGKTLVLLGSSGVGKSTLVNALAGGPILPTGAVRESDGRGRHTTSRRALILLPSGALVIDTPGVREVGLWDAERGLEQSFADVERYLGHCKFSDCRHESEPGCAVKHAIRSGALSQQRWESYQKLRAEARFFADKDSYLQDKEQRLKRISQTVRAQKQVDHRRAPCWESFTCRVCGAQVFPEEAGTEHRNHCPHCLSSVHADHRPGDRASLCRGVMDPIGVWVRKNGEWALIHRCRDCGALCSNRIAADDNPTLLMSIAMKPLASPPFPLWRFGEQGPML